MWVPVAVWQPCELLYACYLLTQQAIWCLYNRLGRLEYYPGSHAAWNFPCEISSTSQVLENEFGPEKSWNLLGNDADADAKICASAHLCSVSEQFLCYFFTTCDSDEHTLQYGCCYHSVYIWLVTAFCLYIWTLLAYDRVLEKCFWAPGKVREFFVTKREPRITCLFW